MDAKQIESQEFFHESKQDTTLDNIQDVRDVIRNFKDFEKTLHANFHNDEKLEITKVDEGVYEVKVFVCQVKISEGRCMKLD
jgi:hypothetical protein